MSESSLLNPGGCFPRHCRQGNIRPGKGVKNCREDDCRGEGGGVLYGRGERRLRVGDFGTQRTRVAEFHYARAVVALLSGGKGYGDDEKGVEVADNVNEGIAETVFDRDCEPRRRG